MKQKNNTSESKTEFLFESDADKYLLKEAAKALRPKVYKKIIRNTIIISIILTSFFFTLDFYEKQALNDIKASTLTRENSLNVPKEKLIKNNSSFKKYNIFYDNKYYILINKSNPITDDEISEYKLKLLNDNLFGKIKLEEQTYNNYINLKENLSKRGYYINIKSGFRTLRESELIYNQYKSKNGLEYAKNYVALPGQSEHNTGLAFDFTISKDKYATSTNYDSDEYNYLKNIAYLYGFIIRYPKGKEYITGYEYEPWHLRYVGKELAKYLQKNNLTLEEYYQEK